MPSASMEMIANIEHARTYEQSQPAVVALPDGGFVIAWKDVVERSGGSNFGDIKARRFCQSGKGGPEYLINTAIGARAQEDPDVAVISNAHLSTQQKGLRLQATSLVFAWTDGSGLTAGRDRDVRVAVWDLEHDGCVPEPRSSKVTPELFEWRADFLATNVQTDRQSEPALATIGTEFVVSWYDYSKAYADKQEAAILARRGNAGGMLPIVSSVNTTFANGQSQVSAASMTGGRMIFAWRDSNQGGSSSSGINGARYATAGGNGQLSLVTPDFAVDQGRPNGQGNPDIGELGGGAFAVVWQDEDSNGDIFGAMVRSWTATPTAPQKFNETTAGRQRDPKVAKLVRSGRPGGPKKINSGFVAVWTDQGLTGEQSNEDVRARIFNYNGIPEPGDFLVNTVTAGVQDQPVVAGLTDGRYVVVWRDLNSASGDIKFRMFDPRP